MLDNNERSNIDNESHDGPPSKVETKNPKSEDDTLHNDATRTPIPLPGVNNPEPFVSQSNRAFAHPSHSTLSTDQSNYQRLMINHGPVSIEKNSSACINWN
ncbi:hypothetical protein VNO77_14320 [Canavalia gladiata]|uniref:Uncharacterized protein n=1 Tax=Canavalia gladiata TaxID=3824 RepID=A0AAN9QVD8_CANGL